MGHLMKNGIDTNVVRTPYYVNTNHTGYINIVESNGISNQNWTSTNGYFDVQRFGVVLHFMDILHG